VRWIEKYPYRGGLTAGAKPKPLEMGTWRYRADSRTRQSCLRRHVVLGQGAAHQVSVRVDQKEFTVPNDADLGR
jgi:hypothetical protein